MFSAAFLSATWGQGDCLLEREDHLIYNSDHCRQVSLYFWLLCA